MKKLLIFLISILGLITTTTSSAHASCIAPLTTAEYREEADMVLIGTVEKVTDGTATVKVEEYFKGRDGERISVSGREGISETSVDFIFEPDTKYLLFLHIREDGTQQTNICMGNRIVTDELTPDDRSILGTGYLPVSLPTVTPTPSPVVAKNRSASGFVLGGGVVLACLSAVIFMRQPKKKKK